MIAARAAVRLAFVSGAALCVTPTVAADGVVAAFAGEGPAATEEFTVEDNWELRWDAAGRRFQLTVQNMDLGIPSVAADQIEPGGGVRNYIQGGTYRLDIQANGPWQVEVRQK